MGSGFTNPAVIDLPAIFFFAQSREMRANACKIFLDLDYVCSGIIAMPFCSNKTFFPFALEFKKRGFHIFFSMGGKECWRLSKKRRPSILSEFPPFSNRKLVKVGLVWLVVAPIITVTQ